MKRPYEISHAYNKQMKCYDLLIQIGGIKDKNELEIIAKAFAEYLAGNDGSIKRVGFDA